MAEDKYIIINENRRDKFISGVSKYEKKGYELLSESFNVLPCTLEIRGSPTTEIEGFNYIVIMRKID